MVSPTRPSRERALSIKNAIAVWSAVPRSASAENLRRYAGTFSTRRTEAEQFRTRAATLPPNRECAGAADFLTAATAPGASEKTPSGFSAASNASTPRGPRLRRKPAQAPRFPSQAPRFMTAVRGDVSASSLDIYVSEAGIPRDGLTRARTTVLRGRY